MCMCVCVFVVCLWCAHVRARGVFVLVTCLWCVCVDALIVCVCPDTA